jgi:hypothetical protein
MALQIQQNLKRSKRKLSIFLDLPDSSSLSQNPSISTPAEKKKKVIPIYSESSLSGDSESEIRTQKSQLFIKIPKKTSFDLLQYSELSSFVYSRTPLGLKNINL